MLYRIVGGRIVIIPDGKYVCEIYIWQEL